MAINSNHIFEELGGVKCSIIEKNVSAERATFLKNLLEHNGYIVLVGKSAAPKTQVEALPDSFVVGVRDYNFNPIQAIYGRELKTPAGHFVNLAYWKQEETEPKDGEWYWKA